MARRSKGQHKKTSKINSVASKISELQDEIRKLQLHEKKKQPAPNKQSTPKLIKKPKGAAGRSPPNGYNIQEAMELDKREYNAFTAIARHLSHRYLDPTKTMRDQDQFTVAMVLSFAQKRFSTLADYANNWPMRDLISRFLRNHVQYLKNNDDVLEDALHRSTREFLDMDIDDLAAFVNRKDKKRHDGESDDGGEDEDEDDNGDEGEEEEGDGEEEEAEEIDESEPEEEVQRVKKHKPIKIISSKSNSGSKKSKSGVVNSQAKKASKKMVSVVQQDEDDQSEAMKGKRSKKVSKRVTGSVKRQGEDDQRKTQKRKTTSQVSLNATHRL
ncbi:hypothetical protein PAXINDRAFT_17686 [Paxillus involutus ATCC 200175]|uniref:Unplaced genomic scaffold PAXINscaffold_168, whole genome shotgun sequence n=1 Tax=Paxillus involutus ATCC 200175 TaxID=664439 RepID=A0A0C9TE39_PAXIN|nr:hypothetical protein PAXINDRAFT_17686 [Paxillus involutus ATCC 200175]